MVTDRHFSPFSPSVALSSAVESGDFGNQLFEFRDRPRFVWPVRASFDCRPARRAAQGSAQHRGGRVSFSLGSFFWTSKRKNLGCRAETRPNNAKAEGKTAPFRAALQLASKKHEQQDNKLYQLLVA
jgi:hypothetical protein